MNTIMNSNTVGCLFINTEINLIVPYSQKYWQRIYFGELVIFDSTAKSKSAELWLRNTQPYDAIVSSINHIVFIGYEYNYNPPEDHAKII